MVYNNKRGFISPEIAALKEKFTSIETYKN